MRAVFDSWPENLYSKCGGAGRLGPYGVLFRPFGSPKCCQVIFSGNFSHNRQIEKMFLRMCKLAAEFGYVSFTSLDPNLKPRPSAAAIVRGIADGKLVLSRPAAASDETAKDLKED